MIADIIFNDCTFIGFEGKDEEDIKNKIAERQGLSEYGKSLLIVVPRESCK